jgi:hypothetical protein
VFSEEEMVIWSVIISIVLFFGLLGGLRVGGMLRRGVVAEQEGAGSAAADGVVFAVLGLLIAFTFTTSASKFDERRRLIVQQVNALGTAHLRLDVLAPEDRSANRARLADWLDPSTCRPSDSPKVRRIGTPPSPRPISSRATSGAGPWPRSSGGSNRR